MAILLLKKGENVLCCGHAHKYSGKRLLFQARVHWFTLAEDGGFLMGCTDDGKQVLGRARAAGICNACCVEAGGCPGIFKCLHADLPEDIEIPIDDDLPSI